MQEVVGSIPIGSTVENPLIAELYLTATVSTWKRAAEPDE